MEIGIERFQRQLLELEPVEFLGVATILGVKVVSENEEKTPLSFEEVFVNLLESYRRLSRRKRKNLHRLLEAAVKKEND